MLYDAAKPENHIILLSGIDKKTGESQLEMEINQNGESKTLIRNKQSPEEFDRKLLNALNGMVEIKPLLDRNGKHVLDGAGHEKQVPQLIKGYSAKSKMSLEDWDKIDIRKRRIKEAKLEKLKETDALSKEEKKKIEIYNEYLQKIEVQGHGSHKKLESGLLEADVKLKAFEENENNNKDFDIKKTLEEMALADSRLSSLDISISTPQATLASRYADAIAIKNNEERSNRDNNKGDRDADEIGNDDGEIETIDDELTEE